MQSDAFPTPSIYSPIFQPRLVRICLEREPDRDNRHLNFGDLLDEVAQLINDCSIEESKYFWIATDRLKTRHLQSQHY